jgi:hypothetical protein
MKRLKFLPLVVVLAVAAMFICGQPAQAAENPHHWHVKVLPHHAEQGARGELGGAPTPGLYGVGQAFVNTPAGYADNSDGSELWPCFGSGGTGTAANPDCPSLGDPSVAFPEGAAALGTPAYTWYLASNTADSFQPFGCDASTTADAANFCGQTNTWYEDWSNDSTDELLYIIEATQDGKVIADSGTVDFGPNTFAGLLPAADVVIYGDQNFGTDGVATGPNNGNCDAAFGYPLSAPSYPGVYVVPANKTCVDPVASSSISGALTAQEVKFAVTTELGTPAYTEKTSGTIDGVTCTKTAPCYEVKWTITHKLAQSWYIWLR